MLYYLILPYALMEELWIKVKVLSRKDRGLCCYGQCLESFGKILAYQLVVLHPCHPSVQLHPSRLSLQFAVMIQIYGVQKERHSAILVVLQNWRD